MPLPPTLYTLLTAGCTAPSIYSGACRIFWQTKLPTQSYCTGDPQLYRYALNRKSVLGSSGRYRFPVPLQAHPPVPGGISCCSLPVLPVPKVQAGPVQARPHHSSCFCHLHTAWVLRPSPLFFLFQETVRSVPGFLQKTPHSAWEFSHLSIILSKNGTKATKLLF